MRWRSARLSHSRTGWVSAISLVEPQRVSDGRPCSRAEFGIRNVGTSSPHYLPAVHWLLTGEDHAVARVRVNDNFGSSTMGRPASLNVASPCIARPDLIVGSSDKHDLAVDLFHRDFGKVGGFARRHTRLIPAPK